MQLEEETVPETENVLLPMSEQNQSGDTISLVPDAAAVAIQVKHAPAGKGASKGTSKGKGRAYKRQPPADDPPEDPPAKCPTHSTSTGSTSDDIEILG